jgi:hypothetical protein
MNDVPVAFDKELGNEGKLAVAPIKTWTTAQASVLPRINP